MLKRRGKGKGADAPRRGSETEFKHSSQHPDLASLVADHMLDPNGAVTANWRPSRRGNSPRHRS